jgi:hypothetical protein
MSGQTPSEGPRPLDDPTSIDPVPIYSKAELERHEALTAFESYRLKQPLRAMRMAGPFRCVTAEGHIISCQDGWLALDRNGHPYAITAEEFEATYE